MTQEQSQHRRCETLLQAALSVLLVFAAAAFAAIWGVPADWIRALVPLTEPDGSAAPLSDSTVGMVKTASLALGTGWLALAAATVIFRRRLAAPLGRLCSDGASFAGLPRSDFRRWRRTDRWALPALLLLTFIAGALRWALLDHPMRYDEAHTFLRWISRGFFDVISDYHEPNNHIAHTILSWVAYTLWGNEPAILRLPAWTAGVLLVPGSYWMTRRLFGSRPAWIAAGFVAASPILIDYSINARGYTLVALFFVLGCILASYQSEHATLTGAALLVFVLALGCYTIPTALYGAGIIALWLLLATTAASRRRMAVQITIGAGAVLLVVAVLYLPVLIRSGVQVILANRYVQPLPFSLWIDLGARRLDLLWRCWSGDHTPLMAVLLAAGTIGFLWSLRSQESVRRAAIAMIGLVVPLTVLQRVAPEPQVFTILLPLVYGLLAAGLTYLFDRFAARWKRPSLGVSMVLALALVLSTAGTRFGRPSPLCCLQRGLFTDGEQIVNDLRAELQPGDVILTPAMTLVSGSIQYYLSTIGLPLSYQRGFKPDWGPDQLDGVRRAFAVIPSYDPVCAMEDPAHLRHLQVDDSLLQNRFLAPRLAAEYPRCRVYRLDRRALP